MLGEEITYQWKHLHVYYYDQFGKFHVIYFEDNAKEYNDVDDAINSALYLARHGVTELGTIIDSCAFFTEKVSRIKIHKKIYKNIELLDKHYFDLRKDD